MRGTSLHAASPRPGSGQAGLTLVDVMVAMVIMALALVGLAAAIPLTTSASQQGFQQSQTAAIAEDLFERMRAASYANITSTNFPNQASVAGYAGFSYTLAFADNTPVNNTRTVTLTVTYQPMLSAPVAVSIGAIFAKP